MKKQNLVSIMVNVEGKNRKEMEEKIKNKDFEFVCVERIIYDVNKNKVEDKINIAVEFEKAQV